MYPAVQSKLGGRQRTCEQEHGGPLSVNDYRLRAVKFVHTVVWAFFASCVFGILVAAFQRRFALAGILIGFVTLESVVTRQERIAFNVPRELREPGAA